MPALVYGVNFTPGNKLALQIEVHKRDRACVHSGHPRCAQPGNEMAIRSDVDVSDRQRRPISYGPDLIILTV